MGRGSFSIYKCIAKHCMPKKYARIKTRNPIVETWAVRKRSVCCIPLLWRCSLSSSKNVCRVNVKRQGLCRKEREYSQAHCKTVNSSQAINTVKANSRSHKNAIAMTHAAAVSKIRVTVHRTGPLHPKQLIALYTEVI